MSELLGWWDWLPVGAQIAAFCMVVAMGYLAWAAVDHACTRIEQEGAKAEQFMRDMEDNQK